MILRRLATRAFRNLRDQSIALDPRFNVIEGDNAQGKTNFLEAAYIAQAHRSFRATRVGDVVRVGCTEAEVRAQVTTRDVTHDVHVLMSPAGRIVTMDGKAADKQRDTLDVLPAIVFVPDDLQIPRGSPAARRHFLDQAIAVVWPSFRSVARAYGKALRHRNRLLRDKPPSLFLLLDVYDEQVAGFGAKMHAARSRYLGALGPLFSQTFGALTGRAVTASLRYVMATGADAKNNELRGLATELVGQLRARRSTDLARGSTSAGPHTDDIAFLLDERPADTFGSQGQVRAMVLAFKIAQILDAHQRLGEYPMLLLDDVSSELDAQRNAYLFEFLCQTACQTFVTTTRPEMLPISGERLHLRVVNGAITA